MSEATLVYVFSLSGLTLWLALKHVIAVHHAQRQMHIARSGCACQGRVVAVQRPFMLDACTRLYVDFVPTGASQPVRVCHIDRRSSDERRPALPTPGAIVTVRYLPDAPKEAVIGRLVSD